MVYVTTDDFVNFSDPTVWIDVDRRGGAGSGSIDVTVQKVGDTYYRIYKDENTMSLRQEKSTDLTAAIGGAGVKNYADALKGSAWSEVATNIGKGQANGYGKTFTSGEGPSLFKANDGDANATSTTCSPTSRAIIKVQTTMCRWRLRISPAVSGPLSAIRCLRRTSRPIPMAASRATEPCCP